MGRPRTVQVYLKYGAAWYRYGAATVLLWGLSILLRFELGFYGAQHGAVPLVTSSTVLLMLGLTLLSQNLIVLSRQPRMSTAPGKRASATQGG